MYIYTHTHPACVYYTYLTYMCKCLHCTYIHLHKNIKSFNMLTASVFRESLPYFFCFIYLFLAALGLCCCAQAFSSCGEQELLFIAVCRLLIAVASLVAELRL